MRIESETTESAKNRQLGPLVSLVRAAEPLEELTVTERERIRHRLRAELLASNRRAAGFRWSTALAALGLLLAGGAVFAAAGHFGFIPWPREARPRVDSEPAVGQARRRPARVVRPKPAVASPPTGTIGEGAALPPQEMAAIAETALARPAVAEPAVAPPSARRLVAPGTGLAMSAPAPSPARASHIRPAPASAPGATTNEAVRDGALPSPRVSAIAPSKIAPSPVSEPSLVRPSSGRFVAPGAGLAMSAPAPSPARSSHATPAPAFAPGTATNGQAMLGQALRSLRSDHDPVAALDILARHAALFPHSPLASERSVLEVEALLALGRRDEALARLDGMSLDNTPRSAERHVLRGELRARAQRWREAAADFDQVLEHGKGTSVWQERALWGRAVARTHAGNQAGARADLHTYLQLYPTGRFASEAARLLATAR